ncbi:MAG: hypothetical protein SNJ57_16260 [Cyanobacteriota bacterium]
MQIPIQAKKTLKTSQWHFDPPFLNPGDRATIVGFLVAHPVNPLYLIKRESDGVVQTVYRNDLVACGALEPIQEAVQS